MAIKLYTLGLIYIFVINLIWSASSLLVQLLYTSSNFQQPFYLTYICISLFILLLRPSDFRTITTAPELKIAAPLAPVWFGANFLYYVSLRYSTITSSTVLSTLGGVFCYLLEYWLLPERWFGSANDEDGGRAAGRTVKKGLGVAVCFGGSALMAYFDAKNAEPASDEDSSPNSPSGTKPLLGDTCGLFAAVLYAVYTSYIKIQGSGGGGGGSGGSGGGSGAGGSNSILGDAAAQGTGGRYDYGEIGAGDEAFDVAVDDVIADTAADGDSDDSDPNSRAVVKEARSMSGDLESMPMTPVAPQGTEVSTRLLLGYMGLVNLLYLSALIPVFVWLGWLTSPADLDLTLKTFGFLVFIGIINNVISDYLWAKSVIYTSATVATIGLTLTVPLGVLTDWVDGSGITVMRCVGSLMVVFGFGLVNL
jgi:drug/metabolite transporter (DMT)-like permease